MRFLVKSELEIKVWFSTNTLVDVKHFTHLHIQFLLLDNTFISFFSINCFSCVKCKNETVYLFLRAWSFLAFKHFLVQWSWSTKDFTHQFRSSMRSKWCEYTYFFFLKLQTDQDKTKTWFLNKRISYIENLICLISWFVPL